MRQISTSYPVTSCPSDSVINAFTRHSPFVTVLRQVAKRMETEVGNRAKYLLNELQKTVNKTKDM